VIGGIVLVVLARRKRAAALAPAALSADEQRALDELGDSRG